MSSVVLAIETSTPQGSVAVWRDDVVIFERSFTSERSHNSQLFAPLRDALAACGDSLRAIVVGTGPASYTGVRIGIAAAQGIAVARKVPVCGLPSVMGIKTHVIFKEAIPKGQPVWPRRSSSYYFCGDARRGSFFFAEVRGGEMGLVFTVDAESLRRHHAETQQSCPWVTFDPKPPLELSPVYRVTPSAAPLAQYVARWSDDALALMAALPLEPFYLAPPFITPGKAGPVMPTTAPDIRRRP